MVPIVIKGTPPFFVRMELTTSGNSRLVEQSIGNDQAVVEENGRYKFHPFEGDNNRRVGIYGLQVHNVGVYTIKLLKEEHGDEARLLKTTPLVVAPCPSAEFVHDAPQDQCVGEIVDLKIKVRGISPFSVLYEEQIGKNEQIRSVDKENLFASPENKDQAVKDFLNLPILELDHLIQPTMEVMTFQAQIVQNEPHLYKIARILDHLGNAINYIPNLPKLESKHGTELTSPTNSDFVLIQGHSPPTVQFIDCQNIKIKTEYDSLHEQAPTSIIPVKFEGGGDYELEVEFIPQATGLTQPIKISSFKDVAKIVVVEPGLVKLGFVKDRYCKGMIQGPRECRINGVNPPTFSYTMSAIDDSCVGAIGTNLDVTFTGEAPFTIEYRIVSDDGSQITKAETFSKSRVSLVIRPEKEGTFKYIFDKVGDSNYSGIKIKDQILEQTVHAPSHAKFDFIGYKERNTKCVGDSLTPKVSLTGKGPWKLSYNIQHGLSSQLYTVEIPADQHDFELPKVPFDSSGTYLVDLLEIKDSHDCSRSLGSEPLRIEVLPSRPTIGFQSVKTVYILEGTKARLPVTVSGHGPFRVSYRNLKSPESVISHTVPASTRFLEVSGDGTWEILRMADTVCQGIVEGSQITVVNIQKPAMSLSHVEKSLQFCAGTAASFQVDFSGKAPFGITYNHTYVLKGKTMSEIKHESVDTSFIKIPFDTQIDGKHIYQLLSISDENYRDPILSNIKGIQTTVNTNPSADFVDLEQNVFQCRSRAATAIPVRVMLQGKPPFEIVVEEKVDNQHKRYINRTISSENLTSNVYTLLLDNLTTKGRYDYSLVKLIDSSGCGVEYDRVANAPTTFVEIADQAQISNIHGPSACVGDLITYSLQGSPPFTIEYSWSGKLQSPIELYDPIFSLWAGTEGELQITRICNSAGCCDDSLSGDKSLAVSVHPLPQAVVDDGMDNVDEIREGNS